MPESQRLKHERLASERATLLLGCYRRSDAIEPDIYIRAITIVLAAYDEWVIVEATHPRTGIQSTEKFKAWPPNSGEVKAFCDEMAKEAARYAIYDKLPKPDFTLHPLIGEPSRPTGAATHAALCRRYGVRDIPWGLDAVDLAKLAAKHGSDLQAYFDGMKARPSMDVARETAQQVLDRYAAEARQAGESSPTRKTG